MSITLGDPAVLNKFGETNGQVTYDGTPIGLAGADGSDGTDGISPTVTVHTNTASEYTLDITDANGTITTPNLKGADGTNGTNGVDGTDGADGVSPTVAVHTNTASEYKLAITDKNGTVVTPNLRGADGANGTNGTNGINGTDGADGVSPTVTVHTNTSDTYTLDITDKNGTVTTPNLKGASGASIPTVATPDALPQNAQAGDLCLVLRGKQTVIPIDVDETPNIDWATVVVNPDLEYQSALFGYVEDAFSDVEFEEIDDLNETYDFGEVYFSRSGEEGSYIYTRVDNLSDGDSVYGLYTCDAPNYYFYLEFYGSVRQRGGLIHIVPVVGDKDDNIFSNLGVHMPLIAEKQSPNYGYCLCLAVGGSNASSSSLEEGFVSGLSYVSFFAWEPVTAYFFDLTFSLHAGWNHFAVHVIDDDDANSVTVYPVLATQTMRFELGSNYFAESENDNGGRDEINGLHFSVKAHGLGAMATGVFGVLLDEQPNGLYRYDGSAWCPMPSALSANWDEIELPDEDEDEEEEE